MGDLERFDGEGASSWIEGKHPSGRNWIDRGSLFAVSPAIISSTGPGRNGSFGGRLPGGSWAPHSALQMRARAVAEFVTGLESRSVPSH
jgi:hypothetical protein